MANLSDLKSSKFLKQSDVTPDVLVTIKSLFQENIAKEGAEEDLKWTIHFDELDKPMVLNSTNGQLIAQITGITENIEVGWIGKKVVLYVDKNVSFGGKLTGGIRVRAPRSAAEKKDELPF